MAFVNLRFLLRASVAHNLAFSDTVAQGSPPSSAVKKPGKNVNPSGPIQLQANPGAAADAAASYGPGSAPTTTSAPLTPVAALTMIFVVSTRPSRTNGAMASAAPVG